MITEDEARELYGELLEKLRRSGAPALAEAIEVAVLRGALRNEAGPRAKGLAYYQTPLPPREALVVALRMFLAALDPFFQAAQVRAVLRDIKGTGDTETNQVKWAFDRIGPAEGQDSAAVLQADPQALEGLESLALVDAGSVSDIHERVGRLVPLVQEFEVELGQA